MQPLYSTISVKKISKKNSPKNEKKKLHILCIGRDKIGHDFRNFLKLFFEVQKDIKKDARISPDTVVTVVNVNIKMIQKWKIKMYIFQDLFLSLCFHKGSFFF